MRLKQKITFTLLGIASVLGLSAAAIQPTQAAQCAGVATSIIQCDEKEGGENTVMWLLVMTVNIMAIGVAIAAVGGVVWAAILYTTAADNPAQVAKAKTILFNVAIGLAAYGLMFSLINFLVPGGVFNARVPDVESTVVATVSRHVEVAV